MYEDRVWHHSFAAFATMNNFISMVTVLLLLSLVGENSGQQWGGSCPFPTIPYDLVPGRPYNIYTDYSSYLREYNCKWIVNGRHDPRSQAMNVSCSLTVTENHHALIIQDRPDAQPMVLKRSGYRNFVSDTNQIMFNFVAGPTNFRGRFSCTVEIVQKERQCRCGSKNRSKIVGGVEAGVNEYPQIAGLIDSTTRMVFCGATIHNKRQVLTAAHCVINRDVSKIGVLVGDHNLFSANEAHGTMLYRVTSAQVHPLYNSYSQDYDIAIITVNSTMAFNQQVQPVCLPFQRVHDDFAAKPVEILGWGSIEFAGPHTQKLQKARVRVITNAGCRTDELFKDVTDRQLCTYARGKDACQFDSGFPVLWENPETRRVVAIGIISQGDGCAQDKPGINTRVSEFIDWIVRNTPEDIEYCRVE